MSLFFLPICFQNSVTLHFLYNDILKVISLMIEKHAELTCRQITSIKGNGALTQVIALRL